MSKDSRSDYNFGFHPIPDVDPGTLLHLLRDMAFYDSLKYFSYNNWPIFTELSEQIYTTAARGHIRYILTLSRILVIPDIRIHFRIRIGIPDNFGFVLKTRYWNRWQSARSCPLLDAV